ncbi:MAG: Stp1/IreP family PP2C-type Ser/Thr phosphatase [Burkholderiaceae bacterium]|nr:Stp1/IreP family PP2C-type Ser/Thr phosphatase [Burkholderiaceae bacterium]
MSVQIYAETDPGLQRAHNEDSVAFDVPSGLCILADGMGGHKAGEVASGMASAFLKSELREWVNQSGRSASRAEVRMAVERAIAQANSAIYNMSKSSARYSGMGTTLVTGLFHENALVLAHIGDSRCYRLRGEQLEQLTKDHSVHQEQVDAGLRGAGPASREQKLVTRALGVDERAEIDVETLETAPGDIYLMCSDGLSDMVENGAIAAILRNSGNIAQRVKHLVNAANAAGGRDNISVLIAEVDAPREPGLLNAARRMLSSVWSG